MEIHRAAKAAVCEIIMVNPGQYIFVQTIQLYITPGTKPNVSFDDNVSMWAQQLCNKWATLGKENDCAVTGVGKSL